MNLWEALPYIIFGCFVIALILTPADDGDSDDFY
jgi:Sec-independent protein secretion pathway component TatC